MTDDLLRRAGLGVTGPHRNAWPVAVQYVRAHHLDDHDLRHFVLRHDRSWLLEPGVTWGAGRDPQEVDRAAVLLDENGEPDPAAPRLALHLGFSQGLWWLTNRSRSGANCHVSAPGLHLDLSNTTPALPLRFRRLTVCVPARPGDGGPVEHRFTVLLPAVTDNLPSAAEEKDDESTANPVSPPNWSWAQQRLLAAWAYPELIGLPPRGLRRGATTRQLLRQQMSGKDPNEKPLAGLRRRAQKVTGIPMVGEPNTPAFLTHLVTHRRYLGAAITALHQEYLPYPDHP